MKWQASLEVDEDLIEGRDYIRVPNWYLHPESRKREGDEAAPGRAA